LSAFTNKAEYNPGQTVTISGRVLDNESNPVAGASISIQVNDPPIRIDLIVSDQSGSYSDQFVLPNTSLSGVYVVYISAGKPGYTTAKQQLEFTVSAQTTTNTTQPTTTVTSVSSTSTTQITTQTKCFIATATFGSELSPEVVFLRTFRDSDILQTSSGRSFMVGFNAFYYSFSPEVASFIAFNAPLRYVMKAAIYPLIGILSISYGIFNLLQFNRELGVTLAGIFAALGIGIVYIGPVAVVVYRLCISGKSSIHASSTPVSGICCFTSLLILIVGEVSGIPSLLMVGSVSTVLSFTFLGALCAVQLTQLLKNRRIQR
jgi:peptide/nickel transport system substrate-binding protein